MTQVYHATFQGNFEIKTGTFQDNFENTTENAEHWYNAYADEWKFMLVGDDDDEIAMFKNNAEKINLIRYQSRNKW